MRSSGTAGAAASSSSPQLWTEHRVVLAAGVKRKNLVILAAGVERKNLVVLAEGVERKNLVILAAGVDPRRVTLLRDRHVAGVTGLSVSAPLMSPAHHMD